MIGKLEYKWIVGIVFVFGLFMDLLDMTITNVAIPAIGRDLNLDPREGASTIQWVVTGYLLSLAVFIPVSGWAGDRFGTKKIFLLALCDLHVGASLLCGLAWNIESLIAFRVLQGVGGGILTPVGTAMLFRAFPPADRAKASAILMIPMVVAPASGPVLGGYLVEYHDWRWIFLINIPSAFSGIAFAGMFLREEKQPNTGRLDIPGFVLGGRRARCGHVRACAGRHPRLRRFARADLRRSRPGLAGSPSRISRAADARADDRYAALPEPPVQHHERGADRRLRRHDGRTVPAAALAPGRDGPVPVRVGADDVPAGFGRDSDGAGCKPDLRSPSVPGG